jgi:hypothetical protein
MLRQRHGEREPDEQPRHEPGELGEPAVKQVRGSSQRRNGKEREEAVVAQREVAQSPDPVGLKSRQEPDESPEEERGKHRQDRLVPDRDPEVSSGGKDSEGADRENHLADVQGRARETDIRPRLVQQQIAAEERAEQPAI